MHFIAVLNREGGTLRTIDLDAFAARMRKTLEGAGHTVRVECVDGAGVQEALEKAAARKADVVIAGGGDGTISTAAAALQNKKKALAVLPAGTMNLFARSLGIPLDLDAAVRTFTDGKVRKVDMASANGRPFVHQFSIGMHARLVDLRERMEFGSRLGKMRASTRAAYLTFLNPKIQTVTLRIGEAEILTRTTGIGVTNNLFGEGHLPYADAPDGGVLGVYVTIAHQRRELLSFFWNMARGRWRLNDQVEIHQADEVVLKIHGPRKKDRCVIDGELLPMEAETVLRIHPKSLNALAPGS